VAKKKKKLPDKSSQWSEIVGPLADSPNLDEREHTFGGWFHGTDRPFLVSPKTRNGHAIFFGATRSGKTALGMLPMTYQIIMRKNAFIHWIDLKGDMFVFNTLLLLCERLGIPFKYFTFESDKASYLYPAMDDPAITRMSASEKTQVLLASAGLSRYDDEGGTSYYEVQGERVVLEAYTQQPHIPSFKALHNLISSKRFRIRSGMNRRDYENAGALFASVRRFAEYPQLDGAGCSDAVLRDAISLSAPLTHPGVNYYRLPVGIEPKSAQTLARFVIRQQLAVARKLGGAKIHNHFCVDEYQEALQQSLLAPLKQCADLNFSFMMTVQNMSDLVRPSMNALDVILGNTAMQGYFAAKDPTGSERLVRSSGKTYTVVENRGSACSSLNGSSFDNRISSQEGQSEVITDRFTTDTINYLNSVPRLCIVDASPMDGFTRLKHPLFVETIYMTSEAEFRRRSETPWPEQTESTILGPPPAPLQAPPAPDEPQPPAPKSAPKSPQQRARRSSAARSQAEEELANYLKQIARPNSERTDDESIVP
jgi:hypothetical protein